jgi:integrase
MLERGGLRNATIISLLAYAGLRPSELLALTWGAIRGRTLLIERATDDGEIKSTKGSGRARTVRLLGPLATDLAEWRMSRGRPDDDKLVFPARHGGPWRDGTWQSWHRDVWRPVTAALGIQGSRPYDLRHSFASLRIQGGRPDH